MQDNVRGKALHYPFMRQTFFGSQALFGVPLEAPTDEIDEGRIWRFSKLLHDVLEAFFFLVLGQHF
jgi:hypothetical protein